MSISFLFYIVFIILLTAMVIIFCKSRLDMVVAGATFIVLGLLWFHFGMIPGRLAADIVEEEATFATWLTIACGVILLVAPPMRRSSK